MAKKRNVNLNDSILNDSLQFQQVDSSINQRSSVISHLY